MTGYVVLLIVCAAGLALSLLRYDAGKKRRETTARLAEEMKSSPTVSPTEELFRSEGVPVPDAMLAGLASAPAPAPPKIGPMIQAAAQNARQGLGQLRVPTGPDQERSDLDSLVKGVELPCDLAPLVADGPSTEGAVFVTATAHRDELHDELHTAFARIGCSVNWADNSTAAIRRGPFSGRLSIEAMPERPELVAVRVAATP
jgi:hypothetical protein